MSDQLSADFVVIGSGICGALTALQLVKAGSVLILEAGPRMTRDEVVANFRNGADKGNFVAPYPISALAPHPVYRPINNQHFLQAGPEPYEAEYLRVVGGTSWHWAAQAWRVVPNDFRIKTLYDVGVDWPISYDDLEPFYQHAEELMGVSGAPNTGSPRAKPFPMEPVAEVYAMGRIRERIAPLGYDLVTNTTARNSRGYDNRPACCGNNNCMPICPIDAQYHGGIAVDAAESAGAKLVANAAVYRIEHDAAGKIVAVHYYDEHKVSHRVTGKTFILAANGVESPRLLLLSASARYPNGLANSSDCVGRHLMDHPSSALTFYADEELWPGRGPMSPSSINALRDGAFRRHAAAYRIDFSNSSQVRSVTADLIKEGVYGAEFDKQLRWRAARQIGMKNVLEVLPHPENRITLSDQKDPLGIPKPLAHYAIDDYTRRGAERCKEDFTKIAKAMGGTGLRYSAEGKFGNNQHITGTMRMGNDPATSVVDAWGRTHDHENLYIVSTGVMPTAATVNSTLTAVALGLRTAQHILAQHGAAVPA